MKVKISNFKKIKKRYFKFIRSQDTLGKSFQNKMEQLKNFYLPISQIIFKDYCKYGDTRVIGLSGAQGTGKSTIAEILKIILKEKYNLNTIIFSIDDFYKTLNERKEMSKKISKLFLTRGVPGTHDTKILLNCFKQIKKKSFKKFLIPKFDKSIDDRLTNRRWTKVKKKPHIVIFEGWCVGAKAQSKSSLIKPINELERKEDKNLIWRQKVNYELQKNYKKIFKFINILIFLKVPNFEYVYKWRTLQEMKLKKNSKGIKTMSRIQVKRFIMFYERITRNMLKTLNFKSKLVINMHTNHKLKSIKFN